MIIEYYSGHEVDFDAMLSRPNIALFGRGYCKIGTGCCWPMPLTELRLFFLPTFHLEGDPVDLTSCPEDHAFGRERSLVPCWPCSPAKRVREGVLVPNLGEFWLQSLLSVRSTIGPGKTVESRARTTV